MNSDIHGLPACEVEYENETYCRCHCCDGGIIVYADIHSARGAEYKIPQTVDMTPVAEEPAELYALSAVLMDGESGRVLYEKDGERPLANASTTKVLTCIVALENSSGMIMFRFLRMRHPSRK